MTSKSERSGLKRSVPRRLLSFNSVKTTESRAQHDRSQTDTDASSVNTQVTQPQAWTSTSLVDSPKEEDPVKQHLEKPMTKQTGKKVRKLPSLPSALPLRPATPDSTAPPPSPSIARWETVRRHVMQSTPVEPVPQRPQSPQPSVISSTSGIVPPRSATPKPSRFARLGFRQVVEQAREIAVDDSRRFAQDIQKACLATHYGEIPNTKSSRFEREPFHTGGSSLHLPFMISASHSQASSANASTVSLNLTKKQELRRPQSIQSMAVAGRAMPSVKPLHQVLAHASSLMGNPILSNPLPRETLVLSALLTPFLSQESSPRIEEERGVAFEAFDIITRTWEPHDQSVALARCLWCCKAALQPSICRRHILSLLQRMFLHEQSYQLKTPRAILSVLEAIFTLLPAFHSSPFSDPAVEEGALLKDLLSEVRLGKLRLSTKSIEEEYKASASSSDNIGDALIIDALARCLEHSPPSDQRWILVHLVKEYWPRPAEGVSLRPLSASVHARAIRSFCHASLALLQKPADPPMRLSDGQLIVQVLRTRILVEVQGLGGQGALQVKEDVSRLVLEVLTLEGTPELAQWGVSMISSWYRESSDMVGCFESLLRRIAVDQEWKDILRLLSRLLEVLPFDVCQKFLSSMMPSFNEHLADNTPPAPNLMLTALLQQLSSVFPRIFYKPFFSCAASSKEIVVVNHLRILTAISKFLPDLWIRDAEMVSVALIGDASKPKTSDTVAVPAWGTARLGQLVILVEIISSLQNVRHRRETSSPGDHVVVDAMKFALSLEALLTVGLETREKFALVPPYQRSLYCVLFREIRLLTKSLKPAPWLSRTVTWFVDSQSDVENTGRNYFDPELQKSIDRIRAIYELAQEGSQAPQNRRSTLLLSPTFKDTFAGGMPLESKGGIANLLAKKKPLLESLSRGFAPKALKLFVAVSALLNEDDLRRIARLLWVNHLTGDDARAITEACFLIMQCAEKEPLEISATIEVDLRSSSAETKLEAIHKLSILSHWRFQLLSQRINMDRTHRPFKLARGPLPFIATDMGSNQFVALEDPNELKDNLPLELRKQLAEIGWASEDEETDQRVHLVKTPLSILPSFHIDRLGLDVQQDHLSSSPSSPNLSPASSPGRSPVDKPDDGGLLRRNSSTGGPLYGVKRKAVFVPSLASLLPRLALVVYDHNVNVANAARSLLIDIMRNDPALLVRPVLDMFSGDQKDISAAVSYLQAFLHIRHVLPPPMTHHVFNNLVGFLKYIARQTAEAPDALHDYAYIISPISSLASQVNSLTTRDIRRAKAEILLVPTGNLWFPSSAPSATAFPRSIRDTRNPFEGSFASPMSGLAYITMIRLSQNLLYLEMLKKNPQDVQQIRKSITRIALPSLDQYSDVLPLELKDYMPRQIQSPGWKAASTDTALRNLSLILSRSYLLLIAQIFRSMPRHLNDRNELAVLVDGLNRVLLAHGDDIGIVGHAMIALMAASTRFRRLFISGGYTLFMPAVIKVYVESEGHQGIRSAIEYAANRFHALHQEAFVFQSLEAAAHLMRSPSVDGEWFAKGIFSLFSSLNKGTPASSDAAGIHDANKVQEREALLMKTAEEQPQNLFKFLRSDFSKGRNSMDDSLPEEYESKPMSVDNFVRLFLTVIAHDPSTMRAEVFLHLFRFLVPHFYHASASARSVLSEGIGALPMLLLRAQGKTKAADPSTSTDHISDDMTFNSLSSESFLQSELFDKSKQPSDLLTMRQDYLRLIIAYCRSGGDPRSSWTFIFGLVDQTLKDPNSSRGAESHMAAFFSDFARSVLLREPAPTVKEVNAFLQGLMPIIASHAVSIDLSSVLEVFIELTANTTYSNDPTFSRAVFTQICVPALAACERAESNKKLKALAFQNTLVSLLSRCVLLRGLDVMSLIEKRKTPSYEFLVGIVLPFSLAVGTSTEVMAEGIWSETWRRETHRNVWIRLVAYAMEACRGPPNVTKGSESFLARLRGKPSASDTQLTTLVIGLQIIKVAIMRAESDLTASLPSIWTRLATLLRSLVNDGSAHFALAGGDNSLNASPLQTPRSSTHFENFTLSMASELHMKSPSLYSRTFHRPRMVDYITWSLMEFLCLYRTPLMLHMRMSIREKVVALQQDLRLQHAGAPSSPTNRRISSTMFSKPRRRLSGLPSPSSSPKLSPVSSYPDIASSHFSNTLQSPQLTSPPASSPQPATTLAPQIIHLGPAEANVRRPYTSPGEVRDTAKLAMKSVRVKSLALIQATYKRIRLVQTFMGYGHLLLPMPRTSKWGEDIEVDDVEVKVWTKKVALDALLREMKDLMEEFEDSGQYLDEDVVIVDPTSTSFPHSTSTVSA